MLPGAAVHHLPSRHRADTLPSSRHCSSLPGGKAVTKVTGLCCWKADRT